MNLKAKAEYAPYYKNSLLYLACIDTEKDLTPEERLLRAHDVGISALLGDTIYNFGELVRSIYSSVNCSLNCPNSSCTQSAPRSTVANTNGSSGFS